MKVDMVSFYKHAISLPPVIGIKIVLEVCLEDYDWIN